MTPRLVAVPAAISPQRMTWLIGITWLAAPFGAWFAWRLARDGQRPASTGRAIGIFRRRSE